MTMTTAELATQTPAQIDTMLAELRNRQVTMIDQLQRLSRELELFNDRARRPYFRRTEDAIRADMADANALHNKILNLMRPLHDEYQRRGGWNRYYLVDAHNGHIHSDDARWRCSRVSTTDHYWLTDLSGRDQAEVVAEAKAQACTVCFPWAPVTEETGPFRTPTQAEAEVRTAERERKAAERQAAEITTPDGGPLFAADMGAWATVRDGDRLRTETAAWRRALSDAGDLALYGSEHPDAPAWSATIDRCVAALAARRGVTEQSLNDEIGAKVRAKAKREGWDILA